MKLKFTVRPPFVVHLESVATRKSNGKTTFQPKVESFWPEDGEIELTEKDARLHLHKLEPVCAGAKELMASEHKKHEIIANARMNSQPTGEAFPGLGAAIAQGVASGVAQALAAREVAAPSRSR